MNKIIKYTEIKSAEECKYDGMSLGEVMLRIDPYDVSTVKKPDPITESSF